MAEPINVEKPPEKPEKPPAPTFEEFAASLDTEIEHLALSDKIDLLTTKLEGLKMAEQLTSAYFGAKDKNIFFQEHVRI